MTAGLYVTDTHPLVWFASGDVKKLGRKARGAFEACEAGDVEIRAPAPVVMETWFLVKNGTIRPKGSFSGWWRELARNGIVMEPLLGEDVLTAASLDWGHVDSFDRLIVGTATRLGLPLITADEAITDSDLVPVVW